MKTKITNKTWILALILPLALMSCNKDVLPGITGEGEIVSETLDLADFTGFANAVAADVYISQGDVQEVIIEAQQNIIDNLELDRVENGFWTIKFDRWVRYAKPIKIYITIPTLDRAVISGSGKVVGETYFADLADLELKISGSGDMELDSDSDAIEITVSGSGDFDLTGETGNLDVLISGSGDIDAFDLQTVESKIRISGAGNARLSVAEYLEASISGSGKVRKE